jgi:hypothetical protein
MTTGTVWGRTGPDEAGRATHLGLESCAGHGDGVRDAVTGGWAGGVGSLDRRATRPGVDAVRRRGRPYGARRGGEACPDLAGSKTPGMPRHTVRGHRESRCRPARSAGRRGTSQDGRHGCTDTGSRRGASDQRSPRARRQEWRGGKATRHGACVPAPPALDAAPGRGQARGAGAQTSGGETATARAAHVARSPPRPGGPSAGTPHGKTNGSRGCPPGACRSSGRKSAGGGRLDADQGGVRLTPWMPCWWASIGNA